jgi:type II secretory pathway pseudopilin PulG
MFSYRKKNKGYSLVEMVIYVTILSVLALIIVNTLLMLTRSYTTVKTNRLIGLSVGTAMERMTREIRKGISIDQVSSVFNGSNGKLVMSSTDSFGNATTTQFYLSSGKVMIKQGTGAEAPLTLASTTISSLVFRQMSTSTVSAVKIEMQIQASSTAGRTVTFDIFDTIVLRGAYKN